MQTKDQRLVSTEQDGYFGLCKIANESLTVGSTIFVDLPEHGISADFTVREIRPCPTPMAGDGYLVTTKFIHENAEILDLWIEGYNEPIGTTASHPFWSEDRQQFVAAGDLRVGENLLLADDTTRGVESITLRPNRETVYNIEVNGEHVFYVGEDGVLVHNSCDIALGRGYGLRAFANRVGAAAWLDWGLMQVTRRLPYGKNFGRAFTDAARRAKRIHFDLDDIEDVRSFANAGRRGFDYRNM